MTTCCNACIVISQLNSCLLRKKFLNLGDHSVLIVKRYDNMFFYLAYHPVKVI
jgi:hypothetical protein